MDSETEQERNHHGKGYSHFDYLMNSGTQIRQEFLYRRSEIKL